MVRGILSSVVTSGYYWVSHPDMNLALQERNRFFMEINSIYDHMILRVN